MMQNHRCVNEPLDDAEMSCAVADDWTKRCFNHSLPDPRPRCDGMPLFTQAPKDVQARKAFLDVTKERAASWLLLGGVVPDLKALAESEGFDIKETVFGGVIHAVQYQFEKLLMVHRHISAREMDLWCQIPPGAQKVHHVVEVEGDVLKVNQKIGKLQY